MTAERIKELSNCALQFHEAGDYEAAEQYFLEALYLINEKENDLYQLVVYGLGINYAKRGNYDGAKRCFEEGRLNARKVQNIGHELEMHHQLVIICREAKDYEAAELLSKEEILYRRKHVADDFEGLAVAYFEAAKIYKEWGNSVKYDQALKNAWAYTKKVTDQ